MKISFIGGGNMAGAIIGSLVGRVVAATDIHVVDLDASTLAAMTEKYGVTAAPAVDRLIAKSDVVVLAVKPDHVREVLADVAPHLGNQLIISIAAGVGIAELSRWSDGHKTIVRAMPNTPALIAMGMTGLYAAPEVSEEQRALADAVMKAVGNTVWVDKEEKMDAITAICGSGPAYIFYFIEAMQQAALELGLSENDARLLSSETFRGASELVFRSEETPSQLRERVTSKGGTTHAAIQTMESSDIKLLIIEAIKAASKRSKEIGDEWAARG